MKKKSYWLSISVFVLILIWTVYYYAMQYTGGFADLKDSIVCGIVVEQLRNSPELANTLAALLASAPSEK